MPEAGSAEHCAGSAGPQGRRHRRPPLRACLGGAPLSVFCDSSALVKRYADEPGAAAVRALPHLVCSCLARVEIPAAIWRKQRLGELSPEDAAVLVGAFDWDWFQVDIAVVALTDEVLESAARLPARYPLRAYDAIQLASALAAREADPDLADFACFDETLAAAARAEGFRVVP